MILNAVWTQSWFVVSARFSNQTIKCNSISQSSVMRYTLITLVIQIARCNFKKTNKEWFIGCSLNERYISQSDKNGNGSCVSALFILSTQVRKQWTQPWRLSNNILCKTILAQFIEFFAQDINCNTYHKADQDHKPFKIWNLLWKPWIKTVFGMSWKEPSFS